jgi:hypothetical protein
MEPEVSPHFFEKYSNVKFPKIRPVGAEFFHAGGRTGRQTDEHEEGDCRSLQSCEFA